jgi:hypothetical protein
MGLCSLSLSIGFNFLRRSCSLDELGKCSGCCRFLDSYLLAEIDFTTVFFAAFLVAEGHKLHMRLELTKRTSLCAPYSHRQGWESQGL